MRRDRDPSSSRHLQLRRQLEAEPRRAGERFAGGLRARTFRVQAVHRNYTVCQAWDGEQLTGVNVNVAKPAELRADSYDGLTVDGLTYAWTGAQARDVTNASDETESQVIIPKYLTPETGFDGSLIEAMPAVIATVDDGGTDLFCAWVELGPRWWAKEAT